ncbi:MAG: glycosyltransferase family 4 protein, partial [Saprospiraceae bacterium]
QRTEIERFVAEQGLQSHITFTGFRKDITDVLGGVDVLLFTSRKEGLGTSLLDAQLSGVPIVATNVGGIPEIVTTGKTGLLANQGDDTALAKNVKLLLNDATLRNQISENAKKSVIKFSKSNMAQQILKTYKTILST